MRKIALPAIIALALTCAACGKVLVTDMPTAVKTVPVDTAAVPADTAVAPVDTAAVPAYTAATPVAVKDTLADVKAKGVLVAGVRGTAPPFGTINPKTDLNEGYDIDFVHYFAKKLGVKVEFKTVTASNRIPMLLDGKVDILAAALTITPDRAEKINFSYAYFLTGKKFLAQKGKFKTLKDFTGKKIGTAKGSAAEKTLAAAVPESVIVPYNDYPTAITALRQGKVHAVSTDEAILAGQLSPLEKSAATRGKFEIPEIRISTEVLGFGIRKDDANFLKFINAALIEMEQTGEARKIFNRWFGPQSECPINRSKFMIMDKNPLSED